MITHHPEETLLLDYATGALPEAVALAIVTHAALCSPCARQIHQFEAVGGGLLAAETPVDCDDGALARILMRLDGADAESAAIASPWDAETSSALPSPLRRYMRQSLHQLPWKRVGRLFEQYRLPLAGTTFRAALLRLDAGCRVPKHSHRGQEFSLVLTGGYRDGDHQFGRGDFAAKDVSDTHQPIVDADGPCLSLVVQDAPIKLSGPLGLLLNRFLRL